MRIAYLDCFSGISGDMTLGAFLDAGLSFKDLSRELAKLKLKGCELKVSKVTRGSIACTKFDCVTKSGTHGHRTLKEIVSLIDNSTLSPRVKNTAIDIFNTIGSAEAKVHGRTKDLTVLHELGEIDSIVDIVGTAIAVDLLDIDEVRSSKVSLGRGFASTKHGVIPIPSPASTQILKGVPVEVSNIESELVTPTGAGIVKTLAKRFGEIPQMEITAVGYGAGTKVLDERPNMLRVMIGETLESFKEDSVHVVETNIDDISPQALGFVLEKVMDAGALDCYITNIQMKKSRPAFKLTAICDRSKLNRVASIIFSETPAIGVRFCEMGRFKLARKFKKVNTAYGSLNVKVSSGPGDLFTASPEYEECAALARKKNIPFRKVYDEARILAKGLHK